jgi:hypothetical protein
MEGEDDLVVAVPLPPTNHHGLLKPTIALEKGSQRRMWNATLHAEDGVRRR